MNKNVDLAELEVEESFDLVDLGDAAEETLQHSPWPLVTDSIYGYGEWNR